MIDQALINDFFKNNFLKEVNEVKHRFYDPDDCTGINLLKKINYGEKIIDIGCGFNLFKSEYPYVVGIDPVTDEADFKVSLQDFVSDTKFDVAFCLGSLQFGNLNDVKQQIAKVVNLLTPTGRIYWRTKAELDFQKNSYMACAITVEDHYTLAPEFNFKIVEAKVYQMPGTYLSRVYAEWERC